MRFVALLVLANVAAALTGAAVAMGDEQAERVVEIRSDWTEMDGTFTAE
jgi:hypothetical protein